MKLYMRDLGTAFVVKVIALIALATFFSYYKEWYPKPQVKRDTLYTPSINNIKKGN